MATSRAAIIAFIGLSLLLAASLMLGTAGYASAAVVTFREGGGSNRTNTQMDGVSINPPTATEQAADYQSNTLRVASAVSPAPPGVGAERFYVLLAFKDMTTLLPVPSGQISAATLTVYGGAGNGKGIDVRRVTTNWLANAAGLNDSNVTESYSNLATLTSWTSGPFSASDYTSAGEVTNKWAGAAVNQPLTFNVLTQVQAMYNSGNYGFALTNWEKPDGSQYNITIQNPNISDAVNTHPTLSLTYSDPGGPRTLTVNSGTGGGSYAAGTTVAISANPPTTGVNLFARWVGATNWILDRLAMNTNIQMPPYGITVTATYVPVYQLTVNSGTGGGSYLEGAVVPIAAGPPPTGKVFLEWVGDTATVANVVLADTSVTMPATNVALTATYISAVTVSYREGGTGGYLPATFDQTDIDRTNDTVGGATYYCTAASDPTYALIGVRDLFTLLPLADGSNIRSATLTIVAYWGDSDYVAVSRCLTNWMPKTAGNNDGNVTGQHAVKDADIHWASGAFSAADYDKANAVTVRFANPCYNLAYDYNVTAMVKAMYDTRRNHGFVVAAGSGTEVYLFSEDNGTAALRPRLSIAYTPGPPPPSYTVTVNSGSGDGSYYEGAPVVISADPPAPGQVFDAWVGDTAGILNVHGASTTLVMPASSVEITATYVESVLYVLTVDSGAGDGDYMADTVVAICADPAPSGYTFHHWSGDTAGVADVSYPSTTVTMPAADATITAIYAVGSGYALTVDSGSGDGNYALGTHVNITADTAPSGKAFNMWLGQVGDVDNRMAAATFVTMPASSVTVTASYRDATDPVDWWPAFSMFCAQEFGAEVEPLAYEMFGNTLQFVPSGEWRHVSQTSAVVAFETNLPADGYIEYGTTPSYGSRTSQEDRKYYLHIHYLKPLLADTLYHYRYVGQDERGNTITSDDMTLTTATPANVVYVPGSLSGPPYVLNQAGKTYLLTTDIVANGLAFDITANNVTLDLGGHTVIYNNTVQTDPTGPRGDFWDFIYYAVEGVRIVTNNLSGFKVVNGTILQGNGNNGADACGIGYSPVYIYSGTGQVAGVTAEYYGSQVSGIALTWAGGCEIHHNIVLDHTAVLTNREMLIHGIGQTHSVHHNLLKRVRHCGTSCPSNGVTYSNEIYVDSCATNSFAIYAYGVSNAECYNNKIFGTGYMVVGVGTVSDGVADVMVHDNFIHLQATAPDARWSEYGSQSGAYCCRITWGGDNIQYYDNVMVTYGRDGGMVRGTWFAAQPDIVDCVFRDNVLKAVLTNMTSDIQGCVVHVGDADPNDAPIAYRGNRLISNFCNARMGEDFYGTGCNAKFYDNTFVKVGPDRTDYRTIGVGYNSRSTGHEFYDSLFEGGASYSSYRFDGSGARDFSVGWTLTVQTEPYADVTIRDSASTVVYTGQADGNGIANALLLAYKRMPISTTYYTPHEVTASLGGNSRTVSVTLDAKKTVEVYLHDTYTLTVNSGTGDGTYDAGTVVAITADAPASGVVFDAWTGDTAGIADLHAASTTITMPAANVAITATYEQLYTLTVNSGSGDGAYIAGTAVAIAADAPASGMVFDAWTGDTAGIADQHASSTTIAMPAANAAITATYKLSGYSLTVNSGSGSGTYGAATVVAIVADAPATGLRFLRWTGDTAGVADLLAASTTITMPSASAAITATYTCRGDLNGDRFVGQGDLNIVLAQWGKSGGEITDPRADANHDNFVGQGDLNIVLADWGKSAP